MQTANRAARNVLHMFYCSQNLPKITCLVGVSSPICLCHTLLPYLGIPGCLSNRAASTAVQIPQFDSCKKWPSSKDLICDIWCVPNKNWSSFKIDLHCVTKTLSMSPSPLHLSSPTWDGSPVNASLITHIHFFTMINLYTNQQHFLGILTRTCSICISNNSPRSFCFSWKNIRIGEVFGFRLEVLYQIASLWIKQNIWKRVEQEARKFILKLLSKVYLQICGLCRYYRYHRETKWCRKE